MKIEYRGVESLSAKQLDDLLKKIKEEVAGKVLDELTEKVGFDIGFSLFIYGEISTHYVSNMPDEASLVLIADVVSERFAIVEREESKNPQKPN